MAEGKFSIQFIAAFSATIGAFGLGNMLGWSSPALPHLVNCGNGIGQEKCDLPVSFGDNENSWIGSTLTLGALAAAIVTGKILIPLLGCKKSMIVLSIPGIAGWVCLLITKPLQVTSPALFYVGRILTGFSGGAFTLLAPTYVSETAETKYRGALGSLMQFQVTFGLLVVYALGIEDAVNWEYITIMCLVVPVLNVVAMLFMPESPVFYVSRSDDEAARNSLIRLRGKEYSGVDQELEEIRRNVRDAAATADSASFVELFSSAVYLKPFIISLMLMFFQQFCGINGILFYLNSIFAQTGSDMDPGLQSFLVGLAQVVATGVAVVIVDKFGRRILLILSALFMCISICGLGFYFFMLERPWDWASVYVNLGWLPLVCLMVFIVAFSLGFGPLAWAMNVELFPREAQATMSSVTTLSNWLFSFLVSKYVVSLQNTAMQTSGLYFLFGGVCFVGTIFCIFAVPETKGKTPEDMKRYYMGQAGTTQANGVENAAYQH